MLVNRGFRGYISVVLNSKHAPCGTRTDQVTIGERNEKNNLTSLVVLKNHIDRISVSTSLDILILEKLN